jgi:hypothetical protein
MEKYTWAYRLLGICAAAFGIWQGWTMRDKPDLDLASSAIGVVACFYIISIGKEK